LLGRFLFALICLFSTQASRPQFAPSLNLSGQTGLINMPSAEQQGDGFLSFDLSRFGAIA
jgi:hypothetical protein